MNLPTLQSSQRTMSSFNSVLSLLHTTQMISDVVSSTVFKEKKVKKSYNVYSLPSRHMTSFQRPNNVIIMSEDSIDVETTIESRYVSTA